MVLPSLVPFHFVRSWMRLKCLRRTVHHQKGRNRENTEERFHAEVS